MALGALAIASLVATGVKGLAGLAQGIGGARKQKNLWANKPQLGVTEGEKLNDQLYKQLASSTEMPGQRGFEDKLGQAYAEGVGQAQKSAVSSLGATQSAVDLAGKKMSAIQDLALQFAEYKNKRQQDLAGWQNQKIDLENQRFQVNQYEPWGQKMNEAVGQKQAGFGSFGSAVDSGFGMLTNLAGTQEYMKQLKSMYPNLGNGGSSGGSQGWQSSLMQVNPNPINRNPSEQNNLLNTLLGQPRPNINW